MSLNKRVVYTCVIGGYDVVFPPLNRDPDVDYVLICDDPTLKVEGWDIRYVARDETLSKAVQNRWYKVFAHKFFPEYRSSIYLDGNLRPLRSLKPWLEQVEENPCDIMVRSHPLRNFVHEEVKACIEKGKVRDPDVVHREYAALLAEGFTDHGALTHNNVLVRDHNAGALHEAMDVWWHYISSYSGRDQISLPHALQTSGAYRAHIQRLWGPTFEYCKSYPHINKNTGRLFNLKARARARAPEGRIYKSINKIVSRL